MSLYRGSKTQVTAGSELPEEFLVQIGVHQGSLLLQLPLEIVVDVITENIREGLMNKILYADDLVVMGQSMENLRGKFSKWKKPFKIKGLKVYIKKTNVMMSDSKEQILKSKFNSYTKCG